MLKEVNRRVNALCHQVVESHQGGWRVAIKDNMAVAGMPLTCASPRLRHLQCFYDAHAVALLKQAGAVIVGKSNMDEFGMGSHTLHSIHGPSRHPLDPARSIGGSCWRVCVRWPWAAIRGVRCAYPPAMEG